MTEAVQTSAKRDPNFEVQQGHTLLLKGRMFVPGNVLPRWFVDRDGGLENRIAFGALGATGKSQNCEVPVEEAKTEDDAAPAMTAEMNRLQRENQEYAESNRQLAGQNADFKRNNADLEIAVGKQAKEIIRLTADYADMETALVDLKSTNEKLVAEAAEAKAAEARSKVQTPKK